MGSQSPEHVSKEDEMRFQDLFNKFDRNHDGRIDIDEMIATLNIPGASGEDQTKEFMEHDADKDGKISYPEFRKYIVEKEKNLKVHFLKMDLNKDGTIDAEEMKETFRRLGYNVDHIEAEKFIKSMDKDGTLRINWSEWRDALILTPSTDLQGILHYWRHSTIIDVGDNTIIPDDFTENEMQTGMWWRHLVSGGAAGAVSRTATAPLDRLKILLQVHGSSKNNMTIKSGFKQMLKEGGVKSLWRGNGINVIKIAPESALKFMAYEQFKRIIHGGGDREIGVMERFAAGSLAGATAQTIIYPMEVLKTRLALRKTGQYSGMIDCAVKVYKHDGIKVFYRGYLPNIMGIIPYAGIDLAIYETLKQSYMKKYKDQDPNVFVLLACGTTSSTCGQLASYPLALIRTRLQADAKSKNTMTSIFTKIMREDGPTGLYRGIAPNFLKVAPAVSISYVVYENVRKYLGC